MTELAYSYAGIIKSEKQSDGTLRVYGKATDDSIDIDRQICDETWLKEAMPDWFISGGNIREQHSSIAAGVATDYESKADGHYITALIVDPVSVKKIETGVLKGFSIGIRGPRVIRDEKAAGGRIVGGQIVEISVVDRPANSNAKMTIAKTVDSDALVAVEQVLKYDDSQERDDSGRFGSGSGGSDDNGGGASSSGGATLTQEHISTLSDNATQLQSAESSMYAEAGQSMPASREGMYNDLNSQISEMKENLGDSRYDYQHSAVIVTSTQTQIASSLPGVADKLGLDTGNATATMNAVQESAYNVRTDLTGSEKSIQSEKKDGDMTINATPLDVARVVNKNLDAVEPDETEAVEPDLIETAKGAMASLLKFDQATYDHAIAALSDLIIVEAEEMKAGSDERSSIKELLGAIKHLFEWYEGEVAEGEVASPNPELLDEDEAVEVLSDVLEMSADANCDKCDLAEKECKCSDTGIEAEKSVIADELLNEIVAKATASAKESVTTEFELLKSALAVEKEKSALLESDLVVAKSATVAGGPKRTTVNHEESTTALVAKAAGYRAKASAFDSVDPKLAKGYREIADDLDRKSKKGSN